MGQIQRPKKVNLLVGLLSNDLSYFIKVKPLLERSFGKIDYESAVFDFTHSDYYRDELGNNIKRKFFSFEKLKDLNDIYKVKLITNTIEKRFSENGKRRVNIDPGYIDHAKLVLFSTKDYTHRIYLHKGIYAEVTLHFKAGTFQAWPWTYPDFQSKEYLAVLSAIRNSYKIKMETLCK